MNDDTDTSLDELASVTEPGAKLFVLPVTKSEVESLAEGTSDKPTAVVGPTAEELAALEQERLFRNETGVEAAQRLFEDAVLPVAAALVNTAVFGRNERVKLEAQKIILDRTMGRVQDVVPEKANDPFKELLASCVRQMTEGGEA